MREAEFVQSSRRWLLVLGMLLMGHIFTAMAAGRVSDDVYIVRVKGPPVAAYDGSQVDLRYAPTAAKRGEKADFTSQAAREYAQYLTSIHDGVLEDVMEPGSFEKLYSYTTVLNAFSVRLSSPENQARLLETHPLILSMEPDRLYQKATTHTPEFLGLPNGAWAIDGGPENAGEGIVVGMLDSGIDPNHASFRETKFWSKPYAPLQRWKGGCQSSATFPAGSCNGKIIGARYFAKGILAANMFNTTYDFASPLDGDGHGTHTSSTAAGSQGVPVIVKGFNYGVASGIAPRARIAVYKVIFRDGGFLSDVLAGIDQAVQDGVDVLSISLGSHDSATGVPCLNNFDIGLLFAVKAGVSVVHAAGNAGPFPLTMNSYGPWLISIAAGLSDRSYANPIILRTGQQIIGSGLSPGTRGNLWHPLIYSEDALSAESAHLDAEYFSFCQSPNPFNVTLVKNKILICNFVEYSAGGAAAQFDSVVATAKNLTAAGVIVISKTSSEASSKQTPFVFDPIPFAIPAVFVADNNMSQEILNFYWSRAKRDKDGNIVEFRARAMLKDSREASFNVEAPQVASFSSRGPVLANTITSEAADLLKPDVVAPGNQIWGAWTPRGVDIAGYNGQRFAMISGTSAATPHMAGIIALVKQKHPEWSVSAIHSAILTTASSLDAWRKPLLAQQPSTAAASTMLGPGSPFDFGSGAVNATAAFNPGLVFERDFEDYVNFLCTLPGADTNTVQDATGATCKQDIGARSSDLNMPSITVANLVGKRLVNRTLKSVSGVERYIVQIYPPRGIKVSVEPANFTISQGTSITLTVTLQATETIEAFTFGSLVWKGSRGHVVRIPLSVSANEVSVSAK